MHMLKFPFSNSYLLFGGGSSLPSVRAGANCLLFVPKFDRVSQYYSSLTLSQVKLTDLDSQAQQLITIHFVSSFSFLRPTHFFSSMSTRAMNDGWKGTSPPSNVNYREALIWISRFSRIIILAIFAILV